MSATPTNINTSASLFSNSTAEPAHDCAHILACAQAETIRHGARHDLAVKHRVSVTALSLGGAARYHPKATTFYPAARLQGFADIDGDALVLPLTNASSRRSLKLTGLYFVPADGEPAFSVGEGLFIPRDFDEIPGIVAVVKDPLDALALWTVGIAAVAVPLPATGVPDLKLLLGDFRGRGWFFIGDQHSGASWNAYTLRQVNEPLSWWSDVPAGQWVRDRIPTVTSTQDLTDLGNTLAALIETHSADPGEMPVPMPAAASIAHVATLPPAAVAALAPEPAYRKYLSREARERDVITALEQRAATEAAIAAADPETAADVAHWVRIGEWASLVAEDEFDSWMEGKRKPTVATAMKESLKYVAYENRICIEEVNREGKAVFNPICNFNARIVREVIHDDGDESVTKFVIEGTLYDGSKLPAIQVPASEFDDQKWITSQWGAGPNVYAKPGAATHLRVAIKYLSGRPPRQTVYAHTGWREIEGRWSYLTSGGAISGTGMRHDIAVELSGNLNRYALPAPAHHVGQARYVRESLGLLDGLTTDRVVFPLFAAIWRAAIGDTTTVISLNGLTGTRKSTLAALVQQHFGAGMDAEHLPGNWKSSAGSLEVIGHTTKDAVVVVDDFIPPVGPLAAAFHDKADSLIRGAGNGSGRQRLRPDATMRQTKPVRGLILSTGETSPRGQSLQARMLQIDMRPGMLDLERLSQCQEHASAGDYAQAMASFVQWLAPQYTRIKSSLASAVNEQRDLVTRAGQHGRTPKIVADLIVGLNVFLEFAQTVGAVTREQALDYSERCQKALAEAADLQTADQASESATDKFLRLVASAIASGRAHVASPTGGEPGGSECGQQWGWRLCHPAGSLVGWVDEDGLYLEPESSFAVACELARSMGDGFQVSRRDLNKRLEEAGLLLGFIPGRQRTARKMLGGVRRPVLHLRPDALSSPDTPTRQETLDCLGDLD
jgi:hypothetical protein